MTTFEKLLRWLFKRHREEYFHPNKPYVLHPDDGDICYNMPDAVYEDEVDYKTAWKELVDYLRVLDAKNQKLEASLHFEKMKNKCLEEEINELKSDNG